MPGQNGAMLGLLAREQKQMQRPEKKQGMTQEDILRLLSGAAPIAGAAIGSVVPGAGTAVGGGVGGIAGMGLGMAADEMRKKREQEELDEEEEAAADLAQKQKLAAFL